MKVQCWFVVSGQKQQPLLGEGSLKTWSLPKNAWCVSDPKAGSSPECCAAGCILAAHLSLLLWAAWGASFGEHLPQVPAPLLANVLRGTGKRELVCL